MLYMPPGNPEAMVHYEDTIQLRAPLNGLRRMCRMQSGTD
jgi:hypothetical protein